MRYRALCFACFLLFTCNLFAASAQGGYSVTKKVPIPGTGSFGTITSTRAGIDMRELQFSLKVIF